MRKAISILGLLVGLLVVLIVPTTGVAGSPPPAPSLQDSDDSCIACHTNQETLEALAVEPEDEEGLSEGEG
jgi:hypothetical protein